MEIKLVDIKVEGFKSINLSFSENKINALIGSNDSGIRNLIDLLCLNKKIEAGVVEINGNKINNNEINQELLKLQEEIFYINEKEQKLFNINILEDLKYYIRNLNLERLYELFDLFGLEYNICNKSYFELSSSEIKKILLIIGIMCSQKILIIENPTVNLDYKSIQTLIKQLKKIKRENRIIILTSYNTNFLVQICDNVIVIDKNQIVDQGDKYTIFLNEKLLNKLSIKVPSIIKFINIVSETKNVKINNTDNINDLIKDIYRNAK